MIKLLALVLVPFFAATNRVRGTNKEKRPKFLPNKLSCYAITAFVYSAFLFVINKSLFLSAHESIPAIPVGVISGLWILLGLWLCFSFGWGKYYPHGLNELGGKKYGKKENFPQLIYLPTLL